MDKTEFEKRTGTESMKVKHLFRTLLSDFFRTICDGFV